MNPTQKIENLVRESPKTLHQIVEIVGKDISPETATRRYDSKVQSMRRNKNSDVTKPLEYKVLMGKKFIIAQKLGDLVRKKRLKVTGTGWGATYAICKPPPSERVVVTRLNYFIIESGRGYTAAKDEDKSRLYWDTTFGKWGKKKKCKKTIEEAEYGLKDPNVSVSFII